MKNLRNLFSGMLAVLAVLLLTGCWEKDNPSRTSLDVDTSTLTLSVGESAVRMAFSKAEDAAITYTSSKPAVATVDQFGKVTAMSEGSATITIEMAETKKSWYAAKTITYEVVVKNVSAAALAATDSKNATTAKTLAEATAGDIGKIVGKDGKIYATKADAEAVATGNAVAMIAYVGNGSNCTHGLAIQLNASPELKKWNNANTYASGLTAVPGGAWRLPSTADWQNMFVGCAVSGDATVPDAYYQMNPIAGFKAKIAATGITWKSNYYWSSTDTGSGTSAWLVLVALSYSNANAVFYQDYTYNSYYVLGCLAF